MNSALLMQHGERDFFSIPGVYTSGALEEITFLEKILPLATVGAQHLFGPSCWLCVQRDES